VVQAEVHHHLRRHLHSNREERVGAENQLTVLASKHKTLSAPTPHRAMKIASYLTLRFLVCLLVFMQSSNYSNQ
jgi:hypothetical protein